MSRRQRVAIVTAVDADVPWSGRAEDSVLPGLLSVDIFDEVVVACAAGSLRAKEFASSCGVRVSEGDVENVGLRILESLNDAADDAVLARFMLRQSWIDLALIRETVEHFEQIDVDAMKYPTDVNYTFGCDVFSKHALEKANRIIDQMPDGDDRRTLQFSPWALMECSSDFVVEIHRWETMYSQEQVHAIRNNLRAALGPGENQHGSSAVAPPARYRWAAMQLESKWQVCDISSGTGGGTEYLAQHCRKIVGIEPDKSYVQAAKTRYHSAEFVDSDSSWLADRPASFDAVVSLHTLEHVPDDSAFLNDIWRGLVPEGRLILEVPLLLPIPLGMPLFPFHDREYEKSELLGLLGATGFRVVLASGVSRNRYCNPEDAREAFALIAVKSG